MGYWGIGAVRQWVLGQCGNEAVGQWGIGVPEQWGSESGGGQWDSGNLGQWVGGLVRHSGAVGHLGTGAVRK